MKKALSVTIGGIVFTIEEDAFHVLDSYLKDVRAYFSQNEDHAEIIADIESGIADKFQQLLRVSKQAVTKEDVDVAIEQIGTVSDFKASEGGEEKKEKNFFENRIKGKKLFRDIDKKVFEGVCAGLGNYFGIDPTFVRIIFVVLIFTPLAALSIVGYLVLWAIVPPAITRIDRMKMSGEEITLGSFSTEEKTEEPKKKESSIAKLIFLPFRILGVFFRAIAKITPICLSFLAGFCIFGTGVGVVVVSILTGIFILFRDRFIFDGPLSTFPKGTDYLFIGALYFAVIFAFIYLIILGISVIKRKYIINGWMTAGFVGIWVVAAIICGVFGAGVVLRISQEYSNQPVIERVIKQEKQFSSLRVEADLEKFDVVYGPTQQVVVSGFKNDIGRISTTIDGEGELIIDESPTPQKRCIFCGHNGDVKVHIETPMLSSVTVNGPMHGDIEGSVMTPESTYILGNRAHITVSGVNSAQIYTVLQTGARLTLKGAVDSIVARVLDYSFLEAQSLSADHADINVLSSGKAYIDATKSLKGNTEDEGEIYYVNAPQVTATDSAHIKQMIRGEMIPE